MLSPIRALPRPAPAPAGGLAPPTLAADVSTACLPVQEEFARAIPQNGCAAHRGTAFPGDQRCPPAGAERAWQGCLSNGRRKVVPQSCPELFSRTRSELVAGVWPRIRPAVFAEQFSPPASPVPANLPDKLPVPRNFLADRAAHPVSSPVRRTPSARRRPRRRLPGGHPSGGDAAHFPPSTWWESGAHNHAHSLPASRRLQRIERWAPGW